MLRTRPSRRPHPTELSPPCASFAGTNSKPTASCTSPSTLSPTASGAMATKTRPVQSHRFRCRFDRRRLKAAGMKGVILTCKHHDGFCLWPTKTTDHSIRQSPWSAARATWSGRSPPPPQRHGLNSASISRPGTATTRSTEARVHRNLPRAATELLTNYGPIFEVWHDGANGGNGYYGGANEKRTIDKSTYYDWPGDLGAGAFPAARMP